jgi:hypothetical protein
VANQTYPQRPEPNSIAMGLGNGYAVDVDEDGVFYRGALVKPGSADTYVVVEWLCDDRHRTWKEAAECSRQKWFAHHG